jgi:16S rRNA (adenine1518-N6/adenine1519-N6)-dimethyltransferase
MGERLGQHFLKNQNAVKEIVSALAISAEETVIEIGPGKGALTRALLATCKAKQAKLIAIERDETLARSLQAEFKNEVELVIGDALTELPKLCALLAGNFKIVGNIPYYITGSLLRVIGELNKKPDITVLMIQKEVARRVTSKPPEMNLLAGAVQFWGDPDILLSLKEDDFDPPPKVKSAVIKITPRQTELGESKGYYEFLKIAFKQPRKLLLNNLSEGYDLPKTTISERIIMAGHAEKARAQDLSAHDIAKLALAFRKP